jgi:putative IMPACT (imprinted ancient) family translation regulator
MSSNSAYRSNAEECLRRARTAQDDREKPFWLNLAQSWLQLAEHSARNDDEFEAQEFRVGSDMH